MKYLLKRINYFNKFSISFLYKTVLFHKTKNYCHNFDCTLLISYSQKTELKLKNYY